MIGQFFTPEVVANCMFRVAGVHGGQRVIDPSCGDGSFLRIAPKALELYGCEISCLSGWLTKSKISSFTGFCNRRIQQRRTTDERVGKR